MIRRTGLAAVVTLLAANVALAQSGTITGTVTGEGARPVANANVVVLGTRLGATTSDDGRYTIAVEPGTYTVRVTRIGFAPDSASGVVVVAGSTTTADFRLAVAAQVLGEVVSIGYGEQAVRDLTGSVAVATPRDFNTGRVVAPEELIRGKIPGVQVVDQNEPGAGIALRIRGGTSATASNDPLYVVDGVPLPVGGGASAGRNPLNFINPNDIESITILKDASSTAIYGSRAANGVVMITTKTGATGPQISYHGSVSTSSAVGGPDMVNAAQYRAAVQQHAPARLPIVGSANTDWLGAIQQDARGVDHNVGLGGRRDDLTYRLGLGWLDQTGILKGTAVKRFAVSLNYADRLVERLNVRAHIKGSRSKDLFTPNSILGNAVAFPATQPIFSAPGTFYEYRSSTGAPMTLVPSNPVAELAQIENRGTTLRSVGNVEAEYEIPFITGLSATVRGGYDIARADSTKFTPSTSYSQLTGSNPGNINQQGRGQQTTVLDAYAKYARDFDWFGSSIDITAGYSAERFRGDYPSFNASGLSTDLLGIYGVPTANDAQPYYSIDEARLASGFGRVNWNLLDRYLFTATVRRDGSSKFAKGNQYGTFPSVAFAWRVLDESWARGRLPLSDLKLRLSWGQNGNQAVGNYLSYFNYGFGGSEAQVQFGNQFVTPIRPAAIDPDLTWERTTSTNLGLDFGFLAGRFTGTIDVYDKKTTDLLFDVPVAAGSALSNRLVTNIGSVRNRGLELGLVGTLIDGGARGFGWHANFNASTNSNKLIKIDRPGITIIETGGVSGGVGTNIQVMTAGVPVRSFYVYEHKRRNGQPIYEDANNDNTINEQDLYVDRNGDNIINSSDLRPYKSPAPDWILGHTSTFSWNGFDASGTFRAYFGNYVYNNVASNLGNYSVLSTGNAPNNLHASVLRTRFATPQYLSDVYVEDASFIRMDNLTVGYTFDDRVRAVRNARIFGGIQNVFTSTDYSGVDPTAGVYGIDNNIYPRSRTYVAGVSLGF